jgi:hypothetical protein
MFCAIFFYKLKSYQVIVSQDDMFSNLQNVAEFFQRRIEIKNMIDIH